MSWLQDIKVVQCTVCINNLIFAAWPCFSRTNTQLGLYRARDKRESSIIQDEAVAGVFGDGTLSFLLISPSTEHTNLSRQDNAKRGLQGAGTVMVFRVGTMEGT